MGAFLMLIVIICLFGIYAGVRLTTDGSSAGPILVFVCGTLAAGILGALR